MNNRQIDNKTKQIRIDKSLHQALKILASEEGITIKTLVEEALKVYGVVETQGGKN
ncbi:MAG: toxin-antitoxin system HicB family antitoxin [Candidatus Shapirobacteria bacterium]|jgi:predicted HicB family RNase H-like nuclease